MPVSAVIFDAGETLFDETRLWEAWADWLSIPRLTFIATLGAVIARGQHHVEAFRIFRPDIDLKKETQARIENGFYPAFELADLYPDALPTLQALKRSGLRVGVAGNQPAGFTSCLSDADVELDLLTTSHELEVEKPDPAFFIAILERLGLPAEEVAYVGDRVDNDVRPALSAGLMGVFLRRGPWGHISSDEGRDLPHSIDSLDQLPLLLSPS